MSTWIFDDPDVTAPLPRFGVTWAHGWPRPTWWARVRTAYRGGRHRAVRNG